MPRVRVAVFPGQGLDVFRLVEVDDDGTDAFADGLARLFGTTRLRDELLSTAHALYRPADSSAERASWFVMVRENPSNGELVDMDRADALELPRLLAAKQRSPPLAGVTPEPVVDDDNDD